MAPKPKRANLTKEQLESRIEYNLEIERQKALARKIFPFIENMKTVYDGQTVVNAVAGYLKLELLKREEALKVSDVPIDLSNEKSSEIKTAMEGIIDAVQMDSAKETIALLETMGSKLPGYLAGVHMKDPMDTIKIGDFIA